MIKKHRFLFLAASMAAILAASMAAILAASMAASVALILASCAGTPQAKSQAPTTLRPLWVTDAALVYPDSEWVCAVGEGADARIAEGVAVTRLAQIFRVDLNSVTTINQQFSQAVISTRGKTVSVSTDSIELAEELVSTSVVSGLVGLQVESWTERSGRAFANARMNRRECSARYSAMIRENENVISQLKREAEQYLGTFEAYQILNLAHNFALVTDNLHSLLTVLDLSAVSRRPAYGNAEAVKSLVQNAARAIIVTVSVTGDTGNRIATAFTECFNSRGFRTNATGANPYTLTASFQLEDVDLGNPRNKFVRYILNCSLKNRAGVEILSFSENHRDGHLTEAEARQRAIRSAEQSIGSTGFAANFDVFLASLL